MIDLDGLRAGSRVYIDTNLFIYFIETDGELFRRAKSIFEIAAGAGAMLVTSELTCAECIFGSAKNKKWDIVTKYDLLFAEGSLIELIELDGALARKAALNGSALGLKLLDSIHFTSAMEADCEFLVTNDRRFRSVGKLTVIQIAP